MAELKKINIGEIQMVYADADPSVDGIPGVPGSLVFENNGTIHIKWGADDTNYNPISSNFASFLSATIDGKTTGSTLIGTTRSNSSERFYPQICHVLLISTTGFADIPTVTVGTNSASYNNLVASTALTGLLIAGTFYSATLINPVISLAGATDIYVNVTGGASATTYVVKVLVRGFYA